MRAPIDVYWWEGYFGPGAVFRRLLRGQGPLIPNFGDQLSPFIIECLTGSTVRYSSSPGKLLGLGSVFFALSDHDTVWGSGLLNAAHLDFARQARGVTYRAVRGPCTRDALKSAGLACPEVYGDPALLLPLLVQDDIPKVHPVGLVPHFLHRESVQKAFPHLPVIDVERPFADVVRAILSCRVILATSLHALIVAEAYRIPSLLVVPGKPLHGDLFKFTDYFESTGRPLTYRTDFAAPDALVEAARSVPPPRFSTEPLLAAFPLARPAAPRVTSWSQIGQRAAAPLVIGEVLGRIRQKIFIPG